MGLVLEGSKEPRLSVIDIKYIDQRRDHFNAIDQHTWKQKYLERMSYYQDGGPIFLLIGGEGNIQENKGYMEDGPTQLYGELAKWANDYHAAIFYLEHRYYGESIPIEYKTIEDFSWLSSRQALNDIAEFVQQMNQQQNFTGPWITFGCSYAGSLATWMRYLFPHLIQGSIADSAPVEAADVNFYQNYHQFTSNVDWMFTWEYQACAEFGWYGSPRDKIDLPHVCQTQYGKFFTAKYLEELRNDTNTYYGSKEIDVENVVSVTAEDDHWKRVAITKDLNENSPAYTIKNGMHCDACDRTDSYGDPESIEVAVRLIAQNIKKWIEEA